MSGAKVAVSVIIPALNEREAIEKVVKGVSAALSGQTESFEIVVIDDGSSDGTGEAAQAAGARVIRHPVNRGYGNSLESGIAAAKNDWILMIDGDGSYPPAEIPKLLAFAPEFDLIIGKRTGVYFWGTPTQALMRKMYLRLASFVVGEKVPDANSGLRLVRRSLIMGCGPVRCLGYSHSTTMTLSLTQDGRFVKYVPIEFHARTGRSKVKLVRDILRTLQIMMQILIAYNPLKPFVTLAAGLFVLSIACFAHDWGLASAVLAIAGLQCFLAGCLLDALRMNRLSAGR